MGSGISDGDTDLFGLPLLAERGRGRPAHVWTTENSSKVSLLFAAGYKPMDVAKVLGITKPTFYKHYFNEISRAGLAPLMMKARQLERLNREAEKGNVAAEKALAAMLHNERINAQAQQMAATPKREARPAKLGKKEEAKINAHGVGGMFAPPAPPSLQ
ncbi:hypothetical protein [Novosphingobium olei]|uniref:hypothetical protein n=1 Tax=Novosphingobium olei TaxID=2728851 RepID=UPI0030929642|nr:histidine phosphatase family protein [Novosphingobium olei]